MAASGHTKLVRRNKGDVWYLKYRLPDGRQIQKKLGPNWAERSRPPAGHYTEKMAEAALREVLVDAQRGVLPQQGNRSGATFEDAAAEYLRYVTTVRQVDRKTLQDYEGVIEKYLLEEFGPRKIEEITPDCIDSYKENLLAEGRLSNRTIVRHLIVLSGIFKRAMRVWELDRNPAAANLVERPRVSYTGEFEAYDREELELLSACASDRQDATLFKVAAFTGLRQGELLGLRWDCVDFVGGLLHVRRNFSNGEEKVPKGKKVRSLPMMAEVVDMLARLKERDHFTEDTDLVFCSVAGGHLNPDHLRRRYRAAIKKAGLRPIRFHDLRHIFGSTAIRTLDPYSVQSYMGHQHYSTTQRYLHHQPRKQDAARLSEAFKSGDESRNVSREMSRTAGNHGNQEKQPEG
ncbi:MAG: site-specific integrase [Solirubrobacterales bacterium]|nr:site-specific integrase [Solirubrobacterales bacterium]